jgi:hypothetical protein
MDPPREVLVCSSAGKTSDAEAANDAVGRVTVWDRPTAQGKRAMRARARAPLMKYPVYVRANDSVWIAMGSSPD